MNISKLIPTGLAALSTAAVLLTSTPALAGEFCTALPPQSTLIEATHDDYVGASGTQVVEASAGGAAAAGAAGADALDDHCD